MKKRRHITYDAPVVPVRYPLDDESITACVSCLPWSVDFSIDEDGAGWVTEWHAAECEWVEWWLSDADLEEDTDGA